MFISSTLFLNWEFVSGNNKKHSQVLLLVCAYITFWIIGNIVWQMNYPNAMNQFGHMTKNQLHLFRNQECWNWFCK